MIDERTANHLYFNLYLQCICVITYLNLSHIFNFNESNYYIECYIFYQNAVFIINESVYIYIYTHTRINIDCLYYYIYILIYIY